MIAVAIACLPVFFRKIILARREEAFFLLFYGAYLAYLILDVRGHGWAPVYPAIMVFFVLPLAAIMWKGCGKRQG